MATFRSFVDIDAWQKARELTRLVYTATKSNSFSRDFGLRDQIRRASVSIMANIAEGYGRSGSGEFLAIPRDRQRLGLRSCLTCLCRVRSGYINQQEFAALKALSEDAVNLTGGLMKYLQQSDFKG